ncbi:MAG: REP-associated tyrosine transposase [Candidatus Binatota bacterium]|jgi:REP element-mobilizing transposase RayT|nr:REP-associated tyrosine transposase [Candidatus Binatota bacterium]
MPRTARLDTRGALHHVRARGVERAAIFLDDRDRADFVARLGHLADAGALRVFAWALMPNHIHLLVQTGGQPLHRSMRALLAGYATRFNRRHLRVGHLFQNRYKSTVCEDEPYFLKLVQYVHLNPVPKVVPDVDTLANYPWTGHSALLGIHSRRWQDRASVLARFDDEPARARALYEQYVRGGADDGAPAVAGGGLIHGRDGTRYVADLRRGRERFTSHERILGSPEFVERVISAVDGSRSRPMPLDELVERVCAHVGIATAAVQGAGKGRMICNARRGIAFLWTLHLGRSGRELAKSLGLCPSAVYRSARLGRGEAARWSALLAPTAVP